MADRLGSWVDPWPHAMELGEKRTEIRAIILTTKTPVHLINLPSVQGRGSTLHPLAARRPWEHPSVQLQEINRLQEADPYFASTLAKGMLLLRAFGEGGGWLGNKTLVERTGLSKPTVTRLARTLVQLGYLRHAPQRGKYALDAGLLELVNPYLSKVRVRRLARPLMQQLAEEIRGSVYLAVASDLQMVYIESCVELNAVTARADIGSSRAMHDSSMGRAYLATIGDVRRLELYQRLRHRAGVGWAALRDDLEASRAELLSRGFTAYRSRSPNGMLWLGVSVPLELPEQDSPMVFTAVVERTDADTSARAQTMGQRLSQMVHEVVRMLGEPRA